MHSMFKAAVVIVAAASPAASQAPGWEADAFLALCVQGGYTPLSGLPPVGYPKAELFTEFPPGMAGDLPIDMIEGWNLEPDPASPRQAAVVAGLLKHPTLGPMAVCTLMFRWARTSDLMSGLVARGAEEDGGFFFLEGGVRVWMVTATGLPENPTGEGIIMGMTENVAPSD